MHGLRYDSVELLDEAGESTEEATVNATLNVMREALEREEVVPFFQRIVDLRTGPLCGFEVLARWIHPLPGAILPENFVSLAEHHRCFHTVPDNPTQKLLVCQYDARESLLAMNVWLAKLRPSVGSDA